MQFPSLAGFVLAGGRSSRMGQDKALLTLGGVSLVQHAVAKLRRLTPQVFILGSRSELAPVAPLVPDLRAPCGPLGGMEAALSQTACDWNLILPVDMPFLPTALLRCWADLVLAQPEARVACFVVDDVPQPAFCLLHREMLPFLTDAAQYGRFKLYSVFADAARQLAERRGVEPDAVFLKQQWVAREARSLFRELQGKARRGGDDLLSPGQRDASDLWFENLNTPEQLALVQRHPDALEG